MSKVLFVILLSMLAPSAWPTTYYLSTAGDGGSDGNSGISLEAPWLTPNHPLTCGDVVLATPSSSYVSTNLTVGHWGPVACPAGNNVAWLKCQIFDGCKITTSSAGIYVDKPYWGVQGFEVHMTANTYAGCFNAVPSYNTNIPIHHVIFANDIANGCYAGGIGGGLSTSGSADYIVLIGNIAFDAAKGTNCVSNMGVYEPYNYDDLPGTHIYIAGNFSFGALNTNPCSGGIPSDGEGINIDSLNVKGGVFNYTGQVVVENNITIVNGGRGIEVEYNTVGATNANVYIRHNTQWGNSLDPNQLSSWCGDQVIASAYKVSSYGNLIETTAATGCKGNAIYALQVIEGNSTDIVDNNWVYSLAGKNTDIISSSGFSFGTSNVLGTNPGFSNPAAPEAPNCSGYVNVRACMENVIANFTPTNPAALTFGYQKPTSVIVYDPLFPQWICNVNLPSGLVTMGCSTSSSSAPAAPADLTVTVQ